MRKSFRVGNCEADCQGFTLAELIVSVGLLGVLLALAVPNMIGLMPEYRLDRASIKIRAELKAARMEAMATGIPVAVIFDADQNIFKVWTDMNEDGATNTSEVVTHSLSDAPGSSFSANYSSHGQFNPDGFFQVKDKSLNLLYILVNHSDTARYDAIIVWPSGQISRYKYN